MLPEIRYYLYFLLFLCLVTFISSCAQGPTRIYNRNYNQDPECYRKYGGLPGYCDVKGR